jgi:hypothetical protein
MLVDFKLKTLKSYCMTTIDVLALPDEPFAALLRLTNLYCRH